MEKYIKTEEIKVEAEVKPEINNVEFCEYSMLPDHFSRQLLRLGRICKVDSGICFHFDKPEIYTFCPVRKDKESRRR